MVMEDKLNQFSGYFSEWKLQLLIELLPEYDESLHNVTQLYGPDHPETRMYKDWVEEIETEIQRRKQ